MPTTFNNEEETGSVLASLRRLIPDRPLQFAEALQIAEWQASRLLQLSGIDDGPVPTDIVSQLPRIRIERRDLPTSGLSQPLPRCDSRSRPSRRPYRGRYHRQLSVNWPTRPAPTLARVMLSRETAHA